MLQNEDHDERESVAGRGVASAMSSTPPATGRSVYRPAASSRLFGLAGTVAMLAAISAGFMVTITRFVVAEQEPALTVVNLSPPASPPEVPPQEEEEEEAARPTEKTLKPRSQPRVESVALPEPPTPVRYAPASAPIPEPRPMPDETDTAAPRTREAPPAPQLSGSAPDSWKGRILARLAAHRRYPRLAMSLRQQGVSWIRFVMDRDGKVHSVSLERSSSFPQLDEEAIKLPKRAQPLPGPPEDVPGSTIELVVPVEFFLRGG